MDTLYTWVITFYQTYVYEGVIPYYIDELIHKFVACIMIFLFMFPLIMVIGIILISNRAFRGRYRD